MNHFAENCRKLWYLSVHFTPVPKCIGRKIFLQVRRLFESPQAGGRGHGSTALTAQALFDIAAQRSDPLLPLSAPPFFDISAQRSDRANFWITAQRSSTSISVRFFCRDGPSKLCKIVKKIGKASNLSLTEQSLITFYIRGKSRI